jgi:hypothetical protein
MTRKEIAKNPEARIFDETGPEVSTTSLALPLTNSEAETEALIAEADRDLSSAGNNLDGLKAHSRAGQRLIELKAHLDHGKFEPVVEARLGIKRQRRAQLMKLARKFSETQTAIEWAKANDRLTRSAYSVDGALALLKAWQHRDDPDPQTRRHRLQADAGQNICSDSSVSKITEFVLFLLGQLALARRHIALIESEMETARRRIAFLESEIDKSGSAHADVPGSDQFVLPLLEHMQ